MSGSDTGIKSFFKKTKRIVRERRKPSPSALPRRSTSASSSTEDVLEERQFLVDLDALQASVSTFFGRECTACSKLTDGGFHSIYILHLEKDTTGDPCAPLEVIARVAFPSFTHEKMESEAATNLFIRAHTSVPVPEIYFWDSDPNNPVGAEYMIIEKVAGESAEEVWRSLSTEQKCSIMVQLAGYISEVFRLRVDSIGSLYLRKDHSKKVWKKSLKLFDKTVNDTGLNFDLGPSVCTMYCSDPEDEFPRSRVLDPPRGPFASAGEWLASIPAYELAFMHQHSREALEESVLLATPPDTDASAEDGSSYSKGRRQKQFDFAQSCLSSLEDVAKTYCGPLQDGPQGHLTSQFSLLHHDFRLSNMQVDPQTAQIRGILDWEATHSAPLWACARLPGWLVDNCDMQGKEREINPDRDTSGLIDQSTASLEPASAEGVDDVGVLRKCFIEHVSPEWREAYEVGRYWRQFQDICSLNWMSWTEAGMKERVELYREQAVDHPGVPLDESLLETRRVSCS